MSKIETTNLLTDNRAAANSTLAIGGVPSPLDSFVVAESSVLRIEFSAEKPAHRQSAKRWWQVYQHDRNNRNKMKYENN
jgi:hypothetical protein